MPSRTGIDRPAKRRSPGTPQRTIQRWQRMAERAGLAAALESRAGYRDAASPGPACPLVEDWLAGHPDGAVVLTAPEMIWQGDIRIGGQVGIYDRDGIEIVRIRPILAVQDDLFGGGRTLLLGGPLLRKAWPAALRAAFGRPSRTRARANERPAR